MGFPCLMQILVESLPRVVEIRLDLADVALELLALTAQPLPFAVTLPSEFDLLLQAFVVEQLAYVRQFGFGLTSPKQQLFTLALALRGQVLLDPLSGDVVNLFRVTHSVPFLIPSRRPFGLSPRQLLFEGRSLPS